MRIAIYTSIFGGYDNLIDEQFQMDGVDYICFTDRDIESKTWKVVKSTPIYNDSNRNAKKYKVLPHRYLNDYDWSIWIDGNIKVISDIRSLCNGDAYKLYDHMLVGEYDRRNCIYDEAQTILNFGKINSERYPEKGIKNWKDNPKLIVDQMNRYTSVGYPKQNGLATTPIMVRNHLDSGVIKHNEDWWSEIKHNSKRDQLSFNYIAWKNKFNFVYLEGDSRNNEYFVSMGKHIGKK
jgi:hypothetical protein